MEAPRWEPAWAGRLPAVNAGLNGTCALLLLAGWVLILTGRVRGHVACMASGVVVSAVFLACYLVYHYQVGSVEFAEVRFPLHFRRHEFLPDSGGDGEYRGGLGVALDLVVETGKPARANTAGDGARHGACGMLGGQDGQPHAYRLLSEGREPRVLKTKEVGIPVQPGDVFEVRSGGGGGWGMPEQRHPEARDRDLAEGFVTAGRGVR